MSSSSSTPSLPPQGPSAPRRRINLTAVAVLGGLAVALVVGLAAAQWYQTHNGASALLAKARELLDQKRPDLAARYLGRYVELRPDDLDALALRGSVLADHLSSIDDANAAIQSFEKLLRVNPNHPQAQTARRRLAELNLKLARPQTAEVFARELVRRDDSNAEGHRVLGRVLAVLAANRPGDSAAIEPVVREFETAQRLEPGNVDGVEQLARYYVAESQDKNRANLLLDELTQVRPKDHQAWLARFRHYARFGPKELASSALAQAIQLAPDSLEVVLTAAEDDRRRGDLAAAGKRLQAISKDQRDDPRVFRLQGALALQDGRPAQAIDAWRSALVQSGGVDPDLLFQLAGVLLDLDRVAEADPLIARYRQLTGGNVPSPEARYLSALRALKSNQAGQAIATLEAIRLQVAPVLAPSLNYNLGQAYQALRQTPKALDAYRAAQQAEPRWSKPRLAESRLLARTRPEEAVAALQRGLEESPGDPQLLIELADVLKDRQARQPNDTRLQAAARRALDQARAAAPEDPGVILIEVEQLTTIGQGEQALTVLDRALTKHPQAVDLVTARANVLYRLNRQAEALSTLETAAKTLPDSAALRVARGRLLVARGQYGPARQALTGQLDRLAAEQRPAVWKAQGEIELAAGDYAAARSSFQQWATLIPDDPAPRLALLELALAANDEPGVRDAVDALRAIEGSTSLYARLLTLWELIRGTSPTAGTTTASKLETTEETRQKIVTELDKMIEENPGQPLGHTLKGRWLESIGRTEEAILSYQAALEREGGAAVVAKLGALYARLGRRQDLELLKQAEPAQTPALDRIAAEAAVRSGDKEQARKLAARVVEADPEGVASRAWQAELLTRVGSVAEAEAALFAWASERPDLTSAWLALLQFQMTHDRAAQARQGLPAILAKVQAGSLPPVQKRLFEAQAQAMVGDLKAADAVFAAALKETPDDERLRQEAARFHDLTGRPKLAEESLRHVLKVIQPPPRWASRQLALLLSGRPYDQAAWAEALRLIENDEPASASASPSDLLARATVLARAPEPARKQEAITILEALTVSSPRLASTRELLTRMYLDAGQGPKALPHAKVLAETEGATAAAIATYGKLLVEAGKLDDAQAQAARLTGRQDLSPLITAELEARILKAKGDAPAALSRLAKLLDPWDPKSNPAGESSGPVVVRLAAELGPREQAIGLARRVAQTWPKPAVLAGVAEVLATLGQIDDGLALCEQAAKAGGPGPRLAALAAVGLATRGVPPPAASPPGQGTELKPEVARRMALADGLVTTALKVEPRSVELLLGAAYLRHYQRRFAEEVTLYDAVRALNPPDSRYMNNLAWTLAVHLGKVQEGRSWIEEGLKRVGPHPELLDTKKVIDGLLARRDAQ